MKLILNVVFVACSCFIFGQKVDTLSADKYFVEITTSDNLTIALKKLHRIKQNQSNSKEDSVFTILHIGDSHIQGDYFSGEIRRSLQGYFGTAGQGLIFPYSLCKSYGPKGVQATSSGTWTSTNILKNSKKGELGISGYLVSTINENASLSFNLTGKFNGNLSNKISIWTSAGPKSYDYSMNSQLKMQDEKIVDSKWMVRNYSSDSLINNFKLSVEKTNDLNNQFNLLGFEYLQENASGINYHHCGIVGAQFTHLIYNAELVQSQIKYLKPDLIIFSFGTNEAYNQKVDTSYYYRSISKFISGIQQTLPNTAILITTAPDTRSQGKTPPSQITTNNQLIKLAADSKISLFDLNKAMGGWGSLYQWHKQNLTLSDKLHFNSAGYALQGKLLTYSFLKSYNQEFSSDSLPLLALKNDLKNGLSKILFDTKTTSIDDSIKITPEKSIQKEAPPKKNRVSKSTVYYTIKSGDTVYAIAKKYKTTAKKILTANKLRENSVISPGQKLIIPLN